MLSLMLVLIGPTLVCLDVEMRPYSEDYAALLERGLIGAVKV